MARNWNAIGVRWSVERVSRNAGDNATDKTPLPGHAQIMVLADYDAWMKHHPNAREVALAALDKSGWRIPAQDTNRKLLDPSRKGGPVRDVEAIREAVYARIMGIRAGVSTTVTVHNLPNGERYDGTSEIEYRQLYIAALIDMGVTADVATLAAQKASW